MHPGNSRAVQDKTFYLTHLKQKINYIDAEINKMHLESENALKENTNADALKDKLGNHPSLFLNQASH
jgi:hypothetical protein